MTPEQLNELKRAHNLLNSPSLAIRLSNTLGKTVELGVSKLSDDWKKTIEEKLRAILAETMERALQTMNTDEKTAESYPVSHKVAATLTGALGGFFGLGAVLLELPVSTGLIFRSIADTARSYGEDLNSDEVRLACLSIFGRGGDSDDDDAAEVGYLAARVGVAKSLQSIAKNAAAEGTAAMAKVVAQVAARFNVLMTEKVAAQSVPILGALAGGAVNLAFIDHFQDVSNGYFLRRKLYRECGVEAVDKAWEELRREARAKKVASDAALSATSKSIKLKGPTEAESAT